MPKRTMLAMCECSGREHEVIEDGVAGDRAGRDEMAMRFQRAQARAVFAAEFGLERFGKRRKRKPFASRRAASELFGDEIFVCAMYVLRLEGSPCDQDCFVCVRRPRRNCRASAIRVGAASGAI